MRPVYAFLVLAGFGLAACSGAVNMQAAEKQCAAESDLSDGFRGEIRAGVSTEGPKAGLRLTVTDRLINPRPPEEFYDDCVFRLTGQGPTRPLTTVLRDG